MNQTKLIPLMQNLMENLLKFTESAYVFRTKDIHKNITMCNLCSHG